jgi:hypothetical protein
MAFPGMQGGFSMSQMLPTLGVAEMLPAILRVEYRALTAQRAHGAVTLNILPIGFHGDFLPPLRSGYAAVTSGRVARGGGTRQSIKNMENKGHPDSGTGNTGYCGDQIGRRMGRRGEGRELRMQSLQINSMTPLPIPLTLNDGTTLATVGDAGGYLSRLSADQFQTHHWKVAVKLLESALKEPRYLYAANVTLQTALVLDRLLREQPGPVEG